MITFLLSMLLLQIGTTTGQGIACSVITYQLVIVWNVQLLYYTTKCTSDVCS